MDARRLDDCVPVELVPSGSHTSSAACSTASGNWTDLSNLDGDVLIVVDVASVTGTGTLSLQVSESAANTGASPSNDPDPRGSLFTITAAGIYALAINARNAAARYLGIVGTLTGFTAAQFSAVAVTRANWNSGAAD